MVYTMFCFKDKRVSKFTNPSLSTLKDPEDLKEDVQVQIIKSDNRAVFKGKNLVILGTFDSDTGKIDCHDPEFLLNCDEVISDAEDYEKRKSSQEA